MTAEIRLGDWRAVLPGTYNPARAVVITDPPFGVKSLMGERFAGGRPIEKGYPDDAPWSAHVRAVLALPAARHVIRGPSAVILRRDYPEARRLCVEVAPARLGQQRPRAIPHLWLGWVIYGRLATNHRPRPPRGDAVVIKPYVHDGLRRRSAHQGTTPYPAAEWAVDAWAEPGYLVIDPYAGTGTIGRAALALGFDYLGAEIVPAWHAEAIRSLRAYAPGMAL